MEQRPLRLGDIVDDYCPRERRITNHVIVALVKNAIRQTRCSTCDTEHVFKAARPPQRRLKDGEADAGAGQLVARADGSAATDPAAAELAAPRVAAPPVAAAPAEGAARANVQAAPAEPAPVPATDERADDAWPAHRPLIRATLPRVEGEQKEPRPIPEFTMHHPRHGYGRGGPTFRADSWSNGNGHGRGGGGGGFRQGPPRDPQSGGLPGGGGGQPGAGGGGKRRRHRRRGRGPKVG
jgi:hypothetical protein